MGVRLCIDKDFNRKSEQEQEIIMDVVNNGNAYGLEQPKKLKRSNESEPIIILRLFEYHQMKMDADIWWHSLRE